MELEEHFKILTEHRGTFSTQHKTLMNSGGLFWRGNEDGLQEYCMYVRRTKIQSYDTDASFNHPDILKDT